MSRYAAYIASIALAVLSLLLALRHPGWWWGAGIFGALAVLGTADVLQSRSTLRRNYPVLAHFRYGLESIGPEMRQYFIESDVAEVPFSREQRALVYQRAKRLNDVRPFGSLHDAYAGDYEWINHSLAPAYIASSDFRIVIGAGCAQPYSASVFNVSAMSFGSLSANAIRALNLGAKRGGFYHDTGEGSISSYHREHGGDLVWEIGSGYFGCRDEAGTFSEERFAANAADPQVKMIEIKLSQGAKPGHGGVLPAPKVSAEIAATRGVAIHCDCVSPAAHSAFATPVELLRFVARLRALSGGKPVGFKLAIGHPWEWFGIAKAMRETGLLPDFIVVDGKEGGTGAAPLEFTDHIGVPLREGLLFVHNTLVGLNLRDPSARPARSSAPSISPASWPPARIGPTRRAASCSPSAASSRRAAIPTSARPASPPRTRCASARWWCRTRPAGSPSSTPTPCTRCATCCAPPGWSIPTNWARNTSCAASPPPRCARCARCTASCSRATCSTAASRATRCSRISGRARAAIPSRRRRGSRTRAAASRHSGARRSDRGKALPALAVHVQCAAQPGG